MDNYIIERRARVRIAWFKRYEEIGNISQVCREFGISRKTFYKWWPFSMPKKDFQGLRIVLNALRAILRLCLRKLKSSFAKLRHKSHYGPRRLAYYLERGYGIKIIRIAP